MPTWFFLLLFGLGGLLLPLIGFQFSILNLLGPLAPVFSVGLLAASAIAFFVSRKREEEESLVRSEMAELDIAASRRLREGADSEGN